MKFWLILQFYKSKFCLGLLLQTVKLSSYGNTSNALPHSKAPVRILAYVNKFTARCSVNSGHYNENKAS